MLDTSAIMCYASVMMQITPEQFQMIAHCFPKQRGNVTIDNLQVLNAILFVAENGCKWRALPERYGNWHTIYTRMNRWAKNGVLTRVFKEIQSRKIARIRIESLSLDSTSVKVHPDGTGAEKKTGHRQSGSPAEDETQKFIWLPQMPVRH